MTQRLRGTPCSSSTLRSASASARRINPVAQQRAIARTHSPLGVTWLPIVLNPRYPLVTDQGAFLLVLRALPLNKSWRGTIDINARSRSPLFAEVPRHVNLRVDGDSTIRTLWSDVSCWRVLLENGAEPERWYVGKESGDAMLVLQPASAEWPRSRLNLVSRSVPLLSTTRGPSPAARP